MKDASPIGARVAKSSGKPKGGKKEIDELRVKKSANGGHVVTHTYKRPEEKGDRFIPAPEPDEFTFGAKEGKAALRHVAKHMDINAGSGKVSDTDDDGQ